MPWGGVIMCAVFSGIWNGPQVKEVMSVSVYISRKSLFLRNLRHSE